MNKTYKKLDINKYKNTLEKEKMINELINADGTIIDRNDNFKANQRIIRSKKTTDDFVRSATQGPEAYFIYGGPYYGINYSRTVAMTEEENVLEEDQDLEENQIDEMKNLVDEIIHNKKDQRGIVKKANEQDIMGDINISIPDISELKKVYEKPMVSRKTDLLLDLIHKEGLSGKEIAIILNHLIDNIDIEKLDDKYREIIGDKIKYGEEDRK
tara:strand:- start:1832 stop:2470 length:639 start_codon:yes stop_codon:yes gene_type:complete